MSSARMACERCLRRSWLLAALSGTLDFLAPDRGRLIETLALEDEELLQAAAPRHKASDADATTAPFLVIGIM